MQNITILISNTGALESKVDHFIETFLKTDRVIKLRDTEFGTAIVEKKIENRNHVCKIVIFDCNQDFKLDRETQHDFTALFRNHIYEYMSFKSIQAIDVIRFDYTRKFHFTTMLDLLNSEKLRDEFLYIESLTPAAKSNFIDCITKVRAFK